MKEAKVLHENVCSTDGRKGKVLKTSGRTPLSNTTNKLDQKCKNLSQQNEDENSLQLQKTSKKPGFTVFEDRAGNSQTKRAKSSRSASVSTQQTQTEPLPSGDADRVVADMCTAEEPSGEYWRQLADSRQRALDEAHAEAHRLQDALNVRQEALQAALQENQQLHQRLATLEEENRLLKEVVEQADGVMAAVQEWTEEQEQVTNGH